MISFLAHRTKTSRDKIIEDKKSSGLDIMHFRDLFALDNQIYSPQILKEWLLDKKPLPDELQNLLLNSSHKRFIVRFRFEEDGCWYSHSLTIHKVGKKHLLKIQDSKREKELYLKTPDPSQKWNIKDFCQGSDISITVFNGRVVGEAELKRFHAKMRSIMGAKSEVEEQERNYIKACQKRIRVTGSRRKKLTM